MIPAVNDTYSSGTPYNGASAGSGETSDVGSAALVSSSEAVSSLAGQPVRPRPSSNAIEREGAIDVDDDIPEDRFSQCGHVSSRW